MPSIQIKGLAELLQRVGAAQANDILEPPMQRSVLRVQRDMAKYPPAVAGSTYRRTGTLGRRWTSKVEKQSSGIRGTVGNNTPYAPWVQSQRFQARTHRNRWQTDLEVLEDNTKAITADFARAIERALDD